MGMTWLLTWLNVSVAIFNAMLQFFSTLKLIKTILKLQDKFRKDDGNDMAVDVAQRECSNIKCYALAFSNIQISLFLKR